VGDDQVGLQGHHLFRKRLKLIQIGARKALVDADVSSLRPSEPLEFLPERCE
jgi:hypothetical protein